MTTVENVNGMNFDQYMRMNRFFFSNFWQIDLDAE